MGLYTVICVSIKFIITVVFMLIVVIFWFIALNLFLIDNGNNPHIKLKGFFMKLARLTIGAMIVASVFPAVSAVTVQTPAFDMQKLHIPQDNTQKKQRFFSTSNQLKSATSAVDTPNSFYTAEDAVDATTNFTASELLNKQFMLLEATQPSYLPQAGGSFKFLSNGSGLAGFDSYYNYDEDVISWSVLDGKLHITSQPSVETNFDYAPFYQIAERYGQALADHLNAKVQAGELSFQVEMTEEVSFDVSLTKLAVDGNKTTVNIVGTDYTRLIVPSEWGWNVATISAEEPIDFENDMYGASSLLSNETTASVTGDWLIDLYMTTEAQYNNTVTGVFSDRVSLHPNGTVSGSFFDKTYSWSFNAGVITLVSGSKKFILTPTIQEDKAFLATVEEYEGSQLVRVFNGQMAKFDSSSTLFTDNIVTKLPVIWLPSINLSYPELWDGEKPLLEMVWGHKFSDDGTLLRGISGSTDDNGNPTFYMGNKWNYSLEGNEVVTTFTYDDGFYRERHWEVISVDNDGQALIYEYEFATYDFNYDGQITEDETVNYILPRMSSFKKLDLSLYTEAWESLPDTDNDGLNDYEEADYGTSVDNADTDNDGVIDGDEVLLGLNPLSQDSDGDGFTDGFERDQGTDPKSATSKPGSTTLSFTTTELNNLDVALLDPVKDGWIQNSGTAVHFNANGSGMFGDEQAEVYSKVNFTWSVIDNKLQLISHNDVSQNSQYFSYPFTDLALRYGQDLADWLVSKADVGEIEMQLFLYEDTVVLERNLIKNAIEDSQLEVIVSTKGQRTLLLPESWGWTGGELSYENIDEQIVYWVTNIADSTLMGSSSDLAGQWSISLQYSVNYSPTRGDLGEVNSVFSDLITLNANGSAQTKVNNTNYQWEVVDNALELSTGNQRVVVQPFKQQGKRHLAYYSVYDGDALSHVYLSTLAKFDDSYTKLTTNLTSKLPHIYFAGINAHIPDQWDGEQLKFVNIFGYQFRDNGTLRRGISGAYDYNSDTEFLYMGNEWTYSVDGNQVVMSYITNMVNRVRTWEVLSVDDTGRAVVLESSIYGYDYNYDGVISSDESGYFIAPRINTLDLIDLSDWSQPWNELPDSDMDGLNDYQESDYGTDMYNSDSDFDGILDGDEVRVGLNPIDANDALADYDNDGLTNAQEVMYGTDINNSDSDGDGLSDGDEIRFGLNPLDPNDGGSGPSNLMALSDVNGDGVPDWLKFKLTGTEAQFSVVSGSTLAALTNYSASYELESIKVQLLDDRDADGIAEVGLFGFSASVGRYQLYVFNGVNGQAMGTWNWPATLGEVEFVALKDLTLDGLQEYAIAGVHLGNGTKQLVVKDGATKATYDTFKWPNLWLDTQIVVLTDVTADGVPEIGLYGRHERLDKGQLFVYDGADSSAKIDVYNWNRLWDNISLFEMDDVDGEGTIDWGQFGQRKDDDRYQWVVKKGHDKLGVIRTFTWPGDLTDVTPLLVADRTNDGVREVAVVGKDNDGKVLLRINDGRLANTRIANFSWPAVWDNTQVIELGDLNNDSFNEFALLGVNVNSGRHQIVIKNGQDTSEYGRITLDGVWVDMQLSSYDADNDGIDDVIFSGVENNTLSRFINTYSGADLSLISSAIQ